MRSQLSMVDQLEAHITLTATTWINTLSKTRGSTRGTKALDEFRTIAMLVSAD